MAYKGYKDKDKRREYKKLQMREYRKSQCEKDARTEAETREQLQLFNEFMRAQMDAGFTPEQAKQQYIDGTTPPTDEPTPISQASDSEPAPQEPEPKVSVDELIERNKVALSMWLDMRARKRQAQADSKKPIRLTREELEREKALINASAEVRDYIEKHPIQENTRKLRVLKQQDMLEEELEPRYGRDEPRKKKGKVSGDL